MLDLVRVNIRVSRETYEWFKNKSEKSGVSMSALMALAMEGHINQQQMMEVLPKLQMKVDEIQEWAQQARGANAVLLDSEETRAQAD